MTDQRVLDILNDVLAAMEKSPHARLPEVGVFISSVGTEEHDAVKRILEDERQYADQLARLLFELGGTPSPSPGVVFPDGVCLHYLELHFLLKRIVVSKEQLLAGCESALEQLAGSPSAYQLVSRLASANRDHISLLERLLSRSGSPAVENL